MQARPRGAADANDPDYAGRCFLYVLALVGPEDVLKVGLTNNPLARWSAFHSRWFEVFDLDHSLLVETETRADAQALETMLHRQLVDHQCPVPLTMRMAAGGVTEWYRGAYSAARGFVLERERMGHRIHLQARPRLGAAMASVREKIPSLVQQAFEEHCSGFLSPPQLNSVRDMLDAQRAFDIDMDELIPPDIRTELGLHS